MQAGQLTVRKTIILSTLFSLLLLVGMIVVGWTGFTYSKNALRQEHEETGKAVPAILDARFHIVQIQQFLTDVAATGEREGLKEAERHLKEAQEYLALLSRLQPDLRARSDAVVARLPQFYQTGVRMAEAYIGQGKEAGNAFMKAADGFDATAAALTDALEQLEEEVRDRARESAAATERDIEMARWALALIGAVATAIAALSGWYLLRFLFRLLGDEPAVAADIAERIAQGDLVPQSAEKRAPAESMLGAIARTRAQLANSIGAIHAAAATMANGVDNITAMSERMKTVMHDQSATTATLSSTFEELARSIHGISENAAQANELSARLSLAAAGSKTRIQGAIQGIKTVAAEARDATGVVGDLNRHADAIRSIVGTIKDIADQTNLLALNAAIEAARAGEQGRGFAVVADEVRKLAERTTASTQEVATMVEKIEGGTRTAIEAMEHVTQQANDSAAQADEAEHSMVEVSGSVEETHAAMRDIAQAITEQSAAVELAARSLHEASAATDHNYQAAVELAAIAERIGASEQGLRQEVAHFRV